jgi:sialic acid synthase SpsE
MRIGSREIGPGHSPYVVAEVSAEHCGSYTKAVHLIAAAKDAGADGAKLQLYNPLALAEARGGKVKVLTDGLWKGRTLGDLYQEAHTPREWFPDLFAYAKDIGITLFSSVFDEEGVDYLESLGCPALKIASFELTDLALIRKAASTGKPVIISTGMASIDEIRAAVMAGIKAVDALNGSPSNEEVLEIVTAGGRVPGFERALLHCVSAYPCTVADANLHRLKEAALSWPTRVFGLSDHTLGSVAPVVATALGASIIEKHITLDRKDGGPDAPFSLEPHEFKQMVQDVKDAYASIGTGERPASEIYRDLRRTSA